ncbi:MAG: ATPase [Tannerellaceae bacterium]|jgi:N-acetylglucosamine kinase-like BadF-type ATPase|nr:ATPase [Tannerellaceae bacterium]
MILLADGGSTKTDWRLVDDHRQVAQLVTCGANPLFRTVEDLQAEWVEALTPLVQAGPVETVRFYGAGCCSAETVHTLRTALAGSLSAATIKVESDLLGAARGLCGHEAGIVCILGTGSNSCLYDGREIQEHVSPLGYILGDEGSGAVLGKLLVNACLKNQLTPGLREAFLERFALTPEIILEKVYRQPPANRFLAGLSPFLCEHLSDPSVRTLVSDAFRAFFLKNVRPYGHSHLPVHCCGSIAFHYREVLCEAAVGLGITVATVWQSPMEGLIRYHAR